VISQLRRACEPFETEKMFVFDRMRQAMKDKPTSERIYRELTAEEQCRLADARAETRTLRDDILAEGRLRKRALKLAVDTEKLGMFLIRFCSSKLTKFYLRLPRLIGGSVFVRI